jgi:hypothetical protein
MNFYHIQTMISPRRASLITMAAYTNDVAAIGAARQLLRQGEAVEVWRGETLVYRCAGNALQIDLPRPVTKAVSGSGRMAWVPLRPLGALENGKQA